MRDYSGVKSKTIEKGFIGTKSGDIYRGVKYKVYQISGKGYKLDIEGEVAPQSFFIAAVAHGYAQAVIDAMLGD